MRIGDRTKEIKGEDLKNLEYSKSTRHYEDECNMDAEISDLSEELLAAYKRKIGADEVDMRRVLKARGFIKRNGKGEYLTNAAILLFAENIFRFYLNCRIHFLRYDGTAEQVGTKINIIKDVNLEYPLLKIIEKAKEFVSVQLREFTALNQTTGRFQIVPEYPEFAWVRELNEGVKRIYKDMEDFFLEESTYLEPEQFVKLVLKNNIVMRTMRQSDRTIENIGNDIWNKLDDLERKILVYMGSRATVTRAELEQHISRSERTVGARLNHLMEMGLVKRNGNMYDPKQTYEMVE